PQPLQDAPAALLFRFPFHRPVLAPVSVVCPQRRPCEELGLGLFSALECGDSSPLWIFLSIFAVRRFFTFFAALDPFPLALATKKGSKAAKNRRTPKQPPTRSRVPALRTRLEPAS